MAIVFNCPHCQHPYRLKDEFAGKRAACKNPECRKVIAIPHPAPVPAAVGPTIAGLGGIVPEMNGKAPHAPLPPPKTHADVEAAALAALADAPKEEAKQTEQVIPLVCDYCEHKWAEPLAKAGKFVLCPNPECRQRTKVPVPKDATPQSWRDQPKGPSLAKENFEKPTDVVDAQAKVVSKEAWVGGGGAEQDLEPVALSRRLFFGALVVVPLVALVFGVVSWWNGRTDDRQNRLMADAVKEFAPADLAPAQAPLYAAILEIAAGEYELRQDPPNPDAALKHFAKARDDLRQAPQKDDAKKPTAAGERAVVAGELAAATLQLGGTDEQVKAGARFRWVPEDLKRALRPNERRVDVHTELQRTLDLLRTADPDLKTALTRRLTADLVRLNQPGFAADLPIMLFTEAEQPEAKAVVALELYRRDKSSEKARRIAGELKTQLERGGRTAVAPSAQTLWLAVGTEKPPAMFPEPRPGQPVGDPARLAYTGLLLLQDKPAEALELAARPPGSLPGNLRAITLCAEWAAVPGPALDSALATVGSFTKGKKDVSAPPYLVLRLAQIAAAPGRADQEKELTAAIPDDGLRAWARADAVRLTAAGNKSPAAEAAEVPDDAKKFRAGHAWGRYWVARHNTHLSGDRKGETKAVTGWPTGTLRPFGFAGVAVGLKEH